MIRVRVLGDSPAAVADLEELVRLTSRFQLVGDPFADAGDEGDRWQTSADVLLVEMEFWRDPGAPSSSGAGPERSDLDRSRASAPAVLLVDVPSPLLAAAALSQGARAVLPRLASEEQIVAAIQSVAAGLVSLPTAIADPLLETLSDVLPADGGASPPVPGLTARELEVLALLAEGRGNKGIAARLGISPYTAKAHVASILAKLGASSRAEAVAIGVRVGAVLL